MTKPKGAVAPGTRDALFLGRDLCVLNRPRDTDTVIVAFQPWLPQGGGPWSDRLETDETFERLLDSPLHLVLVHQRGNLWYETPELDRALAVIGDAVRGKKVVTCGLSMGGYAAIITATALSARVFSMAAQYSVDTALVPFEDRWKHDTAPLRFAANRVRTRGQGVRGLNFLDSLNGDDIRHTRLIEADTDIDTVYLPFGSHLVSRHLDSAFGLAGLVTEFASGDLEKRQIIARRRDRRAGDPSYLSSLMAKLLKRGRVSDAVAVLDGPLSLVDLPLWQTRILIEALATHGQADRAGRLYATAAARVLAEPVDFYNLARAARALGRGDDFRNLIAQGLQRFPRSPLMQEVAEDAGLT